MSISLDIAEKRPMVITIGAVVAVLGAAGTLGISTMLAFLLPQIADGGMGYLSHQALFQVMWAVVFISTLIAGVSLISSGVKGKHYDLVPGLTLYFLGAALMINGLILLSSGHTLYAVLASVIGAIIILLEWQTEVI